MFGFSRKGEKAVGYSGTDTHKYIDELINDNARNLKIVTPYLGISYARMLLGISTRKRVQLIVSGDSTKKDEDAIKLLLKKGRHVDWKLILYGSTLAILIALVGTYPLSLSIGILLVVYIYRSGMYLPKHRKIAMKIATTKFIHEKLYISEKMAIVGSANLTYSGTHRNVEHIQIIKDGRDIKELDKHFEELWRKY